MPDLDAASIRRAFVFDRVGVHVGARQSAVRAFTAAEILQTAFDQRRRGELDARGEVVQTRAADVQPWPDLPAETALHGRLDDQIVDADVDVELERAVRVARGLTRAIVDGHGQ